MEKTAPSGGEDGGRETKKGLHNPGSPEFRAGAERQQNDQNGTITTGRLRVTMEFSYQTAKRFYPSSRKGV
jgi:hypothetical protein